MGKRRIDDSIGRDTEDELPYADVAQALILCEQSIVGGSVELEEVPQVRVIGGDAH